MGSLTILQEENLIDATLLANEVYKVLGQTENLTAEVITLSKEQIKSLNATQRGIDKITDVLSFPSLDGIREKVLDGRDFPLDFVDGKLFIGSIAICLEKAEEQAKEFGHSKNREILYLLCHGLLHLFGYDHIDESDKVEMRKLEEQIMSSIGVNR